MKEFKLNANSLLWVFEQLKNLITTNKNYRVIIDDWDRKRTLSANAQQHVWYKQISEFTGDDIRTAGNTCKLDHGLPILLSIPDYARRVSFTLDKIGFYSMSREQQINVMDILQVTSLFKTKQHNLYRDSLRLYWFNNGLELKYKDE
jgi:hypothetical protein